MPTNKNTITIEIIATLIDSPISPSFNCLNSPSDISENMLNDFKDNNAALYPFSIYEPIISSIPVLVFIFSVSFLIDSVWYLKSSSLFILSNDVWLKFEFNHCYN